ncbi:MAG: hypothetical protein AAGK04_11730 [Planctomycetota bacterium]
MGWQELSHRIALSTLAVAGLAASTLAQTFSGIGDLPGSAYLSRAFVVSGDGSIVAGESAQTFGYIMPTSWTPAQGLDALPDLPGGAVRGVGEAASRDGSIIVGASGSASTNDSGAPYEACL